jgi:hypothetical protein
MIKFDETGKTNEENSARAVEQSYSATADNMRDYSLKMIEMTRANTEALFLLARQLANAKAPSDFATLWTTHARKQFEMLSDQARELAALGQKVTGAAPIARNVNQAIDKAS